MRVALVSTYMPPHQGGLERIADLFHRGFLRAGHEVRWLASDVPRTGGPGEDGRERLRCYNVMEDRFGIPVPLWGPSAMGPLRRAAAWADAVLVVECLYLTSALAVAVARRQRRPVVLCQNVGFIPYGSRLVEGVERLAWATVGRAVLRASDHVVLATPTADAFVRGLLGPRLPPASTVPIGIDTTAFRPAAPAERAAARATLGLAAPEPVVLFSARLVEKKGVALMLEVARRSPAVRFVVAGDGPLRHLLAAAPANVRWLGAVDQAAMPALYRAADAVLLPSQGEGLPLTVQEAMACGVPAVIAADEVYAAGLLEAGVCLGAARTAEGMAAALAVALRQDAGLAARARAYAERAWGLDAMIGHYLGIMAGLLEARRRAA